MEESNNEEKITNFKTVQNPENYKTIYEAKTKSNSKLGFGRGFFMPFISVK